MKTLSGPYLKPKSDKIENIILFLHGYGANGEDLISLSSNWINFLPNTIFYSPNAPFVCNEVPNGFKWFELMQRSKDEVKDGLIKAGPYLNNFIDEILDSNNLEMKNLIVIGFSQGTMLSLHHLNKRNEACAGLIGYSGLLFENKEFVKEIKSRFPILLYHGLDDEIINYESSQSASENLKKYGFTVDCIIQKNLGHGIDIRGIEEGEKFIKKIFL